eukprot:s1285_g2.t1
MHSLCEELCQDGIQHRIFGTSIHLLKQRPKHQGGMLMLKLCRHVQTYFGYAQLHRVPLLSIQRREAPLELVLQACHEDLFRGEALTWCGVRRQEDG